MVDLYTRDEEQDVDPSDNSVKRPEGVCESEDKCRGRGTIVMFEEKERVYRCFFPTPFQVT